MQEQISLMLQRNAISEISPDTPGFYSNAFMVRKASGGWRPVIDLKQLNHHINAPHFCMHTISSVLSTVEKKGDYTFKIDLQDAYFHVLIHPHSRKYLRFAFENKVYQFRVLHFSLNTAPQVFTEYPPRKPCRTDNTTVVAYIDKQGGTHSHLLLQLVENLFLWFQTQDITLRARHIPGCLNVIADHLSQPNQPIMTEWSLHPEVVNLIFRLGGTPVVDRFATVHNMHLPQFMALVPEPRALTIDALSQDWQGRSMYMFPPFLLLNKVIQKLRTTQTGEVILIAPWWPSQPWFPHLLRLSVDHLLRFFQYSRDLLSQQGYISSGKSYHLHAWRLLCSTTKQQHFQGRSLPHLLHVGDPPQIECTMTGGYALLPGLSLG